MPFSGEPVGRVTSKSSISLLEKAMLAISLLSLVTMFLVLRATSKQEHTTDKLLENQKSGIIRTYVSRAITCDLSKGIGLTEPKHCDDPEIQKYRDPTIKSGSTASSRASKKTLQVVCELILTGDSPENIKKICRENG